MVLKILIFALLIFSIFLPLFMIKFNQPLTCTWMEKSCNSLPSSSSCGISPAWHRHSLSHQQSFLIVPTPLKRSFSKSIQEASGQGERRMWWAPTPGPPGPSTSLPFSWRLGREQGTLAELRRVLTDRRAPAEMVPYWVRTNAQGPFRSGIFCLFFWQGGGGESLSWAFLKLLMCFHRKILSQAVWCHI